MPLPLQSPSGAAEPRDAELIAAVRSGRTEAYGSDNSWRAVTSLRRSLAPTGSFSAPRCEAATSGPPRPGRPRTFTAVQVAEVKAVACEPARPARTAPGAAAAGATPQAIMDRCRR